MKRRETPNQLPLLFPAQPVQATIHAHPPALSIHKLALIENMRSRNLRIIVSDQEVAHLRLSLGRVWLNDYGPELVKDGGEWVSPAGRRWREV